MSSAFNSTWPFNSSNDFEFDENLVEIKNGKAQLKVLDLEHSGDDFSNGNYVGSAFNFDFISPVVGELSDKDIKNILPTRVSDLVGYWRFNEKAFGSVAGGFDLEDFSSEGNHGTQFGSPGIAQDSPSYNAYSFDGVDDYISIPSTGSLSFNSDSDISISVWLKIPENQVDLDANSGFILEKKSVTESSYPFAVRVQNSNSTGEGTIAFIRFQNSASAVKYLSVNDNKWRHYLYQKKGSDLLLYVNGVLEDSIIDETGVHGGQSLGELKVSHQNHHFTGKVDELAIFTEALSEAEITKLYQTQSIYFSNKTELSEGWTPKWDNIVGYWKMDGNWLDSSSIGNHGTPSAAASLSLDGKVGSHNGSFDGSAPGVSFGDIDSLDFGPNQFSSSFWVKGKNSANETVISKSDWNGTNNGILIYQTNTNYFYWNGTQGKLIGKACMNWCHIGIVRSGTGADQLKIYYNGEFVANFTESRTLSNSVPFYLAGSSSTNHGEYEIDDVAFWDIDLSFAEIKLIYNRQKQTYASHFDSEIIDLGSATAAWPDLSWLTSLPFGKELVGDFDNDGNPDSESLSDYSELASNLNKDLLGLWHFNEVNWSGVTNEVKDSSGNNNHGVANTSDPEVSLNGKFDSSGSFDGDDGITTTINNELNNISAFTTSVWVKYDAINSYQTIFNKGTSAVSNRNRIILLNGNAGTQDSIWFVVENGSFSIGRTNNFLEVGKWYHIVAVFDGSLIGNANRMKVFINGNLQTLTFVGSNIPSVTSSNTEPLTIGYESSASAFYGLIDEPAIWTRALNFIEVKNLYRRGANRVKLQIKSCVDSSCNCESYGTGGSELDCDGDGILNITDTDDIHKSEFIGPGGDGTTYYSELYNRKSSDVIFNCALNTTDSNPGVCLDNEVSLTGSSKPTGPEFLNIDYTQFVKPVGNRYAQYRVYMEADENTACSGEPCLPELSSVSLNPTGNVKYASEFIEVKPKSPINFSKLFSLRIEADSCAMFRLARAGVKYFYDSGAWTVVSSESDRSTANDLGTHIKQFATQFGPGELEVIGYLKSNATGTSQCVINGIYIRFE